MSDAYGGGPYKGYVGYGDPGSFAGSEGRRKIIAALLAKQRKYPTTIGEGIASVGENIGNVLYLNSLAEEDRGRAAYETGLGKGLPTIPVQGISPIPSAGPVQSTTATTPDVAASEIIDRPYVARGAAPGEVPLPPPRPRLARPEFNAAVDANPALIPQMASMVNSENPAQAITQLETLANRQEARGTPLDRELSTRATNPNAYYPAFAKAPGDIEAFKRNVLTPVMRGSDVGGQQLGFSPTGNASGQFAEDRLNKGIYNIAGHIPGNAEMYVQQENPAQLARLEASRVPGRDALTQAIVAQQNNVPAQPVRTAALPPTTITDASTVPVSPLPVPPEALSPNLMTTAAPYRNPVTPTDIKPLPQTAQAPTALPSQEPVPQASPPYVNRLKRPEPLGISPEEAKANEILSNRNIDPNGALATEAKQVKLYYEAVRKEKEAQQQAEYIKAEQRAYEQPGKDLDERYKRGQIELQNATTPTARAKAEADLAKIEQEIAAGKAPETIKFENGKVGQWDQKSGTFKDITPQVNPLDIEIPAELGKKMEYYIRARGASDALAGNASSMTNLASALATRSLNPILGNYIVSPEFRKDYNHAMVWGQAVLRDESGAQFSDKEVERKMSTYWPLPNDPPDVVAQKAANRRREETSFYLSLGKARPVADFYLDRKTEQPEGAVLKDPTGRVRRTVRNGLWMDVPDGR